MKACLIFNPTARGEKAGRLRQRLEALRADCTLRPTIGPGTAGALATEAVNEGFDLIVAAGGDGTVNEVLNGVARAQDGLARARLAVIPLGTANVIAKEIRMPNSVAGAWATICQQKEVALDVGLAEYALNERPCQRLFLQLAGAGVDSRAVDLVVWEHKRRWGKLAYFVAAWRSIQEPRAQIEVVSNGQRLQAEQVLVGNGKFYGGRFPVFPRADLQDGQLEVTLFPRVNWFRLARATCGMLSNRLYTMGGLAHLRSDRITLQSSSRVPFHVEGDNVGYLPVTFGLHPHRVRIIRP